MTCDQKSDLWESVTLTPISTDHIFSVVQLSLLATNSDEVSPLCYCDWAGFETAAVAAAGKLRGYGLKPFP